jgi:hypothetical protein
MKVFVVAKAGVLDMVLVLGVFSSAEKANEEARKAKYGDWELYEREIDIPASPESCDVPTGFTK